MSFYIADYIALIDKLRKANYRTVCVSEFFTLQANSKQQTVENTNQPLCILRHDVDRRHSFALNMAKAEQQNNIQATYYFRCDKHGHFEYEVIAQIAAMGHEIGYHYEELSRARGEQNLALAKFERNLNNLRVHAPCATAVMHGAPLSPHDNRELLEGRMLSQYSLHNDGILSFTDIPCLYLTDTGGQWMSTNNRRDNAGQPYEHTFASPSSKQFIADVRNKKPTLYISTHPERWCSQAWQFAFIGALDQATNMAKRIVRWVRP